MKHLEKFNIFAKKSPIVINKDVLYTLKDKSKIWVYGFDNTKDLKSVLVKGEGSILYVGSSSDINEEVCLDIIRSIKNRIIDLDTNSITTTLKKMGNPNYIFLSLK